MSELQNPDSLAAVTKGHSQNPFVLLRAAERRRCGELRPSLHWKGLLFIGRES